MTIRSFPARSGAAARLIKRSRPRKRSHRVGILVALIAAGAVALGAGVPVASADTGPELARATAVRSPRSTADVLLHVTVHNLSRYTLRVARITSEGDVKQYPAVGALMHSGQRQDFWFVQYFVKGVRHYINYDLLDAFGAKVGTLTVKVNVAPIPSEVIGGSYMTCLTPSMLGGDPAPQCGKLKYRDGADMPFDLTVKDPPGLPPLVYTPSHPQAQRDVFGALCARGNADCQLSADSQRHDYTGLHRVSKVLVNPQGLSMVYKGLAVQSPLVLTHILGSEVRPDSGVFTAINAELDKRFGHRWTPERTYTHKLDVWIKPAGCAAVYSSEPVVRYTGDFIIKVDNTTWRLTDVHFDGVDVAGEPKWEIAEASLGPGASCRLP